MRTVLAAAVVAVPFCMATVERGAVVQVQPAHAAAAGEFVLAADMSQLPMFDCWGSCNQYAQPGQPPSDALKQLQAAGINAIRLRAWVNPTASGNTPVYCNTSDVARMARRVVDAGMSVWLDLHYSDTWADPGHQWQPAAWSSLPFPDLVAAVSNYTSAVVSTLVAQGTPPVIVQTGNEIDNGLLWAAPGKACTSGGALYQPGCGANETNFPQFAALMRAATDAVHQSAPSATIMVHTAQGTGLSWASGAHAVIKYHKQLMKAGVSYDAIGLSCYPHWGFEANATTFASMAYVAQQLPSKRVFIAETAWPYSNATLPQPARPSMDTFPISPQGQADYVRYVVQQMRALPSGAGVAWWGTEYAGGSGAGMTALWDEQFTALPAAAPGWWA